MRLLLFVILISTAAWADGPALDDLSKDDLEKVSNEIAVNFSHTAVAAPSTDGAWGLEVGLVGGITGTPKLKDLVDDAGEDGSDFKRLPHAGLMARAHFPMDLFLELSFIPSVETSDLELSNRTFAVGWNFGGFFSWPIDLALGAQMSNSKLSFAQVLNNASTGNVDVDTTVKFDSKTTTLWLGASKSFAIVTPYVKLGVFKSESDVEVQGTGDIYDFSSNQKESVSSSGGFGALGVNVNLLIVRLGLEASRAAEVGRVSGKLSLAF
jgi:hypothetical protein